MGKQRYSNVTPFMITVDSGGSNGSRVRFWKTELQQLANETGMEIQVSYIPQETSRWNKIEHRLFSAISSNWRGRPLIRHEVKVNLIEATKSRTGLKVRATLDTSSYPRGIKISDVAMRETNHHPESFHGEWNYYITPQKYN